MSFFSRTLKKICFSKSSVLTVSFPDRAAFLVAFSKIWLKFEESGGPADATGGGGDEDGWLSGEEVKLEEEEEPIA